MNELKLRKIQEKYSADELELLMWLHDAGNGVAKEMAELIDFHPANIGKIFNGSYDASLDIVIERIKAAKVRKNRKDLTTTIQSSVMINICNMIDKITNLGAMGMIVGSARRGKTFAVKHWMKAQQGGLYKPVYVDIPPSKTSGLVFSEIARALGVGLTGTKKDIIGRIFEKANSRTVLILDESTRLFRLSDPTEVLELIRRLNDQNGTPIIFVATEWFANEMKSGRLSVYLEQLQGRLEDVLFIPRNVTKTEVTAFLKPYTGEKCSSDIIRIAQDIVSGDGKIATLCRMISDARMLANADNNDHITAEYLTAAVLERKGEHLWE